MQQVFQEVQQVQEMGLLALCLLLTVLVLTKANQQARLIRDQLVKDLGMDALPDTQHVSHPTVIWQTNQSRYLQTSTG